MLKKWQKSKKIAESIIPKQTETTPLTEKTEQIELPTTSPKVLDQKKIDNEKLQQASELIGKQIMKELKTHWKSMAVGLVGILMVIWSARRIKSMTIRRIQEQELALVEI